MDEEDGYEVEVAATASVAPEKSQPVTQRTTGFIGKKLQTLASQKDQALRLMRDRELMRQAIHEDVNEPHVYLALIIGLAVLLGLVITAITKF